MKNPSSKKRKSLKSSTCEEPHVELGGESFGSAAESSLLADPDVVSDTEQLG